MKAVFVELPAFERHRDDYFDDDGFSQLQVALMANPEAGDLIRGNGRPSQGAVRRFSSIEGQARRSARDLLLLDWWPGILAIHLVRQGRNGRSDAQAAGRVKRARKRRIEDEEKVMTKKRDLFKELSEGFDALAHQRAGKRTLRTHAVKAKPVPKLTARELARIRKDLNLSRALFAGYLRTNVRTLENWEQGRAKPNAQAALLIRMVQ
jgi:putative transcriptional regulator